MDIRKEIFNIFQDNKNQFDLYENIITYVDNVIWKTQLEENVEFYEMLRKLTNSINNAGWEGRHSEHIYMINKTMSDISDKYEKYLP